MPSACNAFNTEIQCRERKQQLLLSLSNLIKGFVSELGVNNRNLVEKMTAKEPKFTKRVSHRAIAAKRISS
jgi:hypothetical protein